MASDSIKTLKNANFDDYINELHEGVERLLRANDAEDKIQGIGIGAPNGNYYTGEILNPPNLPWGSRDSFGREGQQGFRRNTRGYHQ